MKYICIFLVALLLCCPLGCAQSADNQPTTTTSAITTVKTTATLPTVGWTTADSMRVRGEPALKAEIIGGINGGTKVEILGKTGDWYEIQFGDGTGFVSGQYLTFTEPATTTAP